MAIEFSFALQSDRDPAAIAEWLSRTCSMRPAVEGRHPAVTDKGIVCVVMPQSELGSENICDAFGISTYTRIVCVIDKFELHSAGMSRLIDICVRLLAHDDQDLVLLANVERGLLLRKRGVVYVDDRDEYWRSQWHSTLSEAEIGYVDKQLPSL
jgi:hypothetical protein